MSCRRRIAWFLAASLSCCVTFGNSHHGGAGGHFASQGGGVPAYHHHHHHDGAPSVVGNGPAFYGFPYYGGFDTYPSPYLLPPFLTAAPAFPAAMVDNGMLGGPTPPSFAAGQGGVPVRRVKRVDPVKAAQLLKFGDRLFRAGNLKRAGERYEQAVQADPALAAPRVGLAQVALVRGQFKESAEQIRAAVAAEPGWLAKAPDLQTVYAEPGDFVLQISRLESHLLVEPGDRDAWLVLGAQLYLSGQTRRASDVFVRLTDRNPEPALSVFLKATSPSGSSSK